MRTAEKMLRWSRNGCVTVSVLLGRVGLRVSSSEGKEWGCACASANLGKSDVQESSA